MLLFEFHGSPSSVEEQAETVQAIAAEHGGHDFEWATIPRTAARLWEADTTPTWPASASARLRAASRRMSACRSPGSPSASTRRSRTPQQAFLPAPILGHVGDGNFHCVILANADDPAEMEEAERLEHPHRRARHRDGRHLHRRARRRHAQDGIPAAKSTAPPPST